MHHTKLKHPVVCFGETLWDILPHAKLPGGAPMNVAYHLNKLGKNPAIISRIGADELGKDLRHEFESRKIDTSFFQIDKVHPTGKVFAEIKENNEVHYDIVKPSAWDFIQWQDDFTSLVEQAEYFVFGSLITRNKQSKNTLFKCLEIAKTKVLDINLRPPHYSKKIVEELLRKADILKLNLAELHLITGWFSDYDSDEDRIKLLKEKFEFEAIIVTKGAEGAILNIDNLFYHHHGYSVKVADTVGSGDSFLAAIISKLIDRSPPYEALDFASALGAFVASRSGGCPDYQLEDVITLMQKNEAKHL
jgi:fructokinase